MKKIIAIFLAVVTLFSVVACNKGSTPTTPTTPKQETNDTPTDEPTSIVFAEDGKSKLYIVVPETLNTGINHARQLLQLSVEDMIDTTLLSGTMSDCEYELHLGQTDDTAKAIYAELGDDKFAIKTVEKKIYIVAKNDLWLYDCVEYFVEKFLSVDEYAKKDNKSLSIVKAIDHTAVTKKSTLRYLLSLNVGGELNATVEVAVTAKNELQESTSSTTAPYRRQGGCFSGTAYYQGLITKNEEYGRIMMRDLATGEMRYSECRKDMGHINDMDYNSKTNEVLVSNGSTIVIFDGTTLAYKRTVTAKVSSGSHIAYDPVKDQYIFARSPYKYVKNDFSGATGKVIEANQALQDKYNYNAFQGTACDGYFFVALQARSGAGTNGGYSCHVAIYGTDGTYIANVKVEIPNGYEPENVSIVDGKIYVAACTPVPTATLYRVVITTPEA